MITINWALVEVSGDFTGFISAASISHNKTHPGNQLSIRYSTSGDSAIVKVGCSTGAGLWSNYDCITAIYTPATLSALRVILQEPRWNPEEEI